MSKITLDDIADALRISKSQVSRALSDKYGVSMATRDKVVLKAIEMGFDFNLYKKQETKKICVIIKDKGIINGEFWSDIIKGIGRGLNNCKIDGIRAELFTIEWLNKDLSEILIEINRSYCSAFVIIARCPHDLLSHIKRLNVPMVFIDYASMDSANYTNVRCNNYQGGLIAGKYLSDTGHKKIMFLGNINYSYSFLQRYYGFCDYLKEKEDVEIFAVTDCKEKGLEKISERKMLFDREKFREVYTENNCDAVMCANDKIAQEIYMYFQNAGVEIGRDVSVLGFDNLALCDKLKPGLSSIFVDRIELGLTAANALRDLLLKSETLYSIEVNTKIVERNSVKNKGVSYE